MNCPKCNAVIDDDSVFCVHCGEPIKTADENVELSEKKEINENLAAEKEKVISQVSGSVSGDSMGQKILKDKIKLIGLIVGTALIAVGIYRITNAGTTISSTSFGADFYTYTYQGIVAISRILASIEVTIGWVIIAIGAAIDVSSLK